MVARTVETVLSFSVDICDNVAAVVGVCSVFEIAFRISIFLFNKAFFIRLKRRDVCQCRDFCVNAETISILEKLNSDAVICVVVL